MKYTREVNGLEKNLSDNEKIRRAEEIYYRRNNRNMRQQSYDIQRQKTYLGSKILLEMLILLIMAVAVFAVKNKDYIFTQEFLANFAEYNVNLTEKLGAFFYGDNVEKSEQIFINNQQNQNAVTKNVIQNSQKIPASNELAAPIESVQEVPAEMLQQNNSETIQMQSSEIQPTEGEGNVTNVQELKHLYSFIKPLEGVVTSGFGSRESQYQSVQGQHKGIDIGADAGTKIKAAMSGVVSKVSSEGDYGNHVKITQNNVTTVYAHCQEIFVIEGQKIQIGQEIASVGSTGNSTGPHLHFEVRIDEICVNPREVIEF